MSLLSPLALPLAVATLAVFVGASAYAQQVIGTPGSLDDSCFGAPSSCCSDGFYPSKGEACFGDADPVAPNDTPQGRGKNRRVVMEIVEAK